MTEQAISRAPSRSCLAVVLAAGEGTRMKSDIPKVLHRVAGRTLVGHALSNVARAGADRIAVVVGPDRDDVAGEARSVFPGVDIFVQAERRGTAHAVLSARPALDAGGDDIIVAFADTPLVNPETFVKLRGALDGGAAVVVLAFEAQDPTGYGRLLMEGDAVTDIREHRDATEDERRITLCNGGIMALRGDVALRLLERVGNENAKGEYYLTDVVAIARGMQLAATVVIVPEDEVHGVNDRAQLAQAEQMMQARLRHSAMLAGTTLIAPETIFLSHDTAFGRDVVVEPHVVFGPAVRVGDGVVIHSFSHLEGATVAGGAAIGPYARLRPGANVGEKAKVGNFVEIKNADLGPGAKVNHLTYIGDATVGASANVGAGTVTCNYDGFGKYRTVIGEGAFIGSNSSLVAPVTIGKGGFTGSGSVITEDVPDDALAVGRARQVVKEGWARTFREKASAARKK
ncbi:bifunctional UDP-N-acetylglucosamine diphosphorylase/glucosamine-1-phosphate N-acetyltransferase GlmU [Microvirga pudoricolor]|uniref:bifunctional UDP-N-acetylglucosamine diphosphorylase/glucosamine-1-phosphate N-acetyltransferase GlmU n=1 Tax=Microvirga pudoricolor TaxID=2778729 RepID=UPI0019512D89|nr:bifunctional UDP-N-acetylglucosamine diphosphorylase/glucosamine-1-phosphate N-acetyltransferase GlmU [Microvirga pudoricolor]MBM6595665.1 bifunctional UDP-N-acetylglucosamine diphosphorylase/glucosamine-1-phosphate N-acetyltransferase GlmU [Microvirga pudoricolor]